MLAPSIVGSASAALPATNVGFGKSKVVGNLVKHGIHDDLTDSVGVLTGQRFNRLLKNGNSVWQYHVVVADAVEQRNALIQSELRTAVHDFLFFVLCSACLILHEKRHVVHFLPKPFWNALHGLMHQLYKRVTFHNGSVTRSVDQLSN